MMHHEMKIFEQDENDFLSTIKTDKHSTGREQVQTNCIKSLLLPVVFVFPENARGQNTSPCAIPMPCACTQVNSSPSTQQLFVLYHNTAAWCWNICVYNYDASFKTTEVRADDRMQILIKLFPKQLLRKRASRIF